MATCSVRGFRSAGAEWGARASASARRRAVSMRLFANTGRLLYGFSRCGAPFPHDRRPAGPVVLRRGGGRGTELGGGGRYVSLVSGAAHGGCVSGQRERHQLGGAVARYARQR